MFKQSVFMLALLVMVSGIFAQKQRGQNPQRIEKEIARMDKALDLTADQQKKINEILEHSRKEMEKDREANKGNRGAMREALKVRKELADVKIKNVLTDDQKLKYEAYQKTRASRAQVDEMKEKLILTDEQVESIAEILQERNEKMKAIREQNSDDREARMEQMKSMMQEYNARINKELNDDQKEKYEQARQRFNNKAR